MRNILLHGVVHTGRTPAGALGQLVIAGHAFDLRRVVVSVRGPSGTLAVEAPVDPRTHQWLAELNDAAAFAASGIAPGARVRVEVGDADDPTGCYSSSETRLEG